MEVLPLVFILTTLSAKSLMRGQKYWNDKLVQKSVAYVTQKPILIDICYLFILEQFYLFLRYNIARSYI